jgi:hypothetical protein
MITGFKELKIPQALTDDEILAHTREMYSHRLPAFIIGHQIEQPISPEEARKIHYRNLGRVIAATAELHPEKKIEVVEVVFGTNKPQSIGRFHNDLHVDMYGGTIYTKTEPIVHTTNTGGGAVRAAYIGDKPALVIKDTYGNYTEGYMDEDHPHNALLRGEVDTDLVRPELYRGSLAPGFSIVLAAGNSSYATWHGMDTDEGLGLRTFQASKIMDVPHGRGARALQNNYEGFDLV